MSKSTGRSVFGRSSGTVTVIEAKVHRSWARKAKVAFYVTAITVELLTMAIASSWMHPVLGLLLGLACGLAAGLIAWAVVRVWPVIRLLWWWLPEIALAFTLVHGWIALASHTNLVARLLVLGLLVGVPAGVPWLRRRIVAAAWCVIVRHRLRTCFAQFIVSNQSGTLPLILAARPTPVGERVWIWLRPGLALPDLQSRLDKIAVACWAKRVVIEHAHTGGSAGFLRVDIARREVLTTKVGSPLRGLVDPDTPTPATNVGSVPTALDLPDITDAKTVDAKTVKPFRERAETPAPRKPALTPVPTPAAASADGEDVSDWI